jgi:poly-gamma-glutamate capsule biosynthesis protein CapA/YwtB (metallophosphatase superfamily)
MNTFEKRTQMDTKLSWRGIPLSAAAVLVMIFAIGRPASPQSPVLTVTLTGQSMIRSDIRSTAPAAVPVISSLVKGADVVFTNFEGTVAEPGQPNETTPAQGPRFLAPPGAMDALKALGFNLIDTSNNHSSDLMVPGFLNTLKEADRVGLVHAGTGRTLDEATAPAYLKTPHGSVALVAIASGLVAKGAAATATQPGVNELRVGPGNVPNEEDTKRILQSIRDASKKADLVMVYEHNHVFDKPFGEIFTEGLPDRLKPAPWLTKWVHAEIDAGADLIVMHGAPILHGIEIYKGKPIFYDLGNFIFNAPLTMWTLQEPMNWESVVPTLEFRGRNVQAIRLKPIVMNFIGEGQPEAHDPYLNNQFLDTRGLPGPAKAQQAKDILERVAELSRPFGATIEVKGDTAEVKLTAGK